MKNKTLHIIAWLLGIVLLLLIVLAIIAGVYGDKIASGYIDKQISKKPLEGHSIAYSSVELDLISLSVHLDSLVIRPDSNFLTDSNSHQIRLFVELDELSIARINPWSIRNQGILSFGAITLQNPSIKFYGAEPPAVEQDDSTGFKEQSQDKNPKLSFIKGSKIEIKGGEFEYFKPGHKNPDIDLSQINVELKYIKLDLEVKNDINKALSIDEYEIDIKPDKLVIPGRFYAIHLGKIMASSDRSEIKIDTFKLIPLYSKERFGKEFGKQTDRFDIKVKQIEVDGFDFAEFLDNNTIDINYVHVDNVNMNIYRDKAIPFDYTNFPKLPAGQLLGLKQQIRVDSIRIEDSYIKYEEKAPEADKAGYVTLDKLNVLVTGANNTPEAIKANKSMVVDGNFRINETGDVDVSLEFPMNSIDGTFAFSGKVGPLHLGHLNSVDMRKLNTIAEPNLNVIIKNGMLRYAEFECFADNQSSMGKLHFVYDSLNIVVLKNRNNEEKKFQVSKFLTGLANTVAHNCNPPKNRHERVGMIHFERDQNKAVFNYIVKSLINGIASIAVPGKARLVTDHNTFYQEMTMKLKAQMEGKSYDMKLDEKVVKQEEKDVKKAEKKKEKRKKKEEEEE